jgi:hypothetical protein
MRQFSHSVLSSLLLLALAQSGLAIADSESDALNLESAATPAVAQDQRRTKFFIEGAIGNSSQRYGLGNQDTRRLSLDFSHTARLGPGLQGVFSDRLDYIYPTPLGSDATINSLREAYVSWQPENGSSILEAGRINLRYGPGYGYYPTDFFRDGSLRTLTTANPLALRENRLGTVMLRAQRLWAGGSLSVAYSPKLASRPSTDGASLDLGSTNNRDRLLAALGTQFSQNINSQVLVYKEDGASPTLGANLTALLSDAAVAHMEWTRGREPDLLSRALSIPGSLTTRNRFSGGVTYTTLGKLSLTAEYEYNGFALSQSNWSTLGATSQAGQIAYLIEASRRQELVPRQAYLIYVTQKSLGLKDLDLTAFLRVNAGDRSRLAWVELRHHWSNFDLAVQLQQQMGRPTTEYGIVPDRRVIQVLGTYYF